MCLPLVFLDVQGSPCQEAFRQDVAAVHGYGAGGYLLRTTWGLDTQSRPLHGERDLVVQVIPYFWLVKKG